MTSPSERRRWFVSQLVAEWRASEGADIASRWGSLVAASAERTIRQMAEARLEIDGPAERLRLSAKQENEAVRRTISQIRMSLHGAWPLRNRNTGVWNEQNAAIERALLDRTPLPLETVHTRKIRADHQKEPSDEKNTPEENTNG